MGRGRSQACAHMQEGQGAARVRPRSGGQVQGRAQNEFLDLHHKLTMARWHYPCYDAGAMAMRPPPVHAGTCASPQPPSHSATPPAHRRHPPHWLTQCASSTTTLSSRPPCARESSSRTTASLRATCSGSKRQAAQEVAVRMCTCTWGGWSFDGNSGRVVPVARHRHGLHRRGAGSSARTQGGTCTQVQRHWATTLALALPFQVSRRAVARRSCHGVACIARAVEGRGRGGQQHQNRVTKTLCAWASGTGHEAATTVKVKKRRCSSGPRPALALAVYRPCDPPPSPSPRNPTHPLRHQPSCSPARPPPTAHLPVHDGAGLLPVHVAADGRSAHTRLAHVEDLVLLMGGSRGRGRV